MTHHADTSRGLYRLLSAMTALMVAVGVCRAQVADTLHVDIHYPVAGAKFNPDFRDNAEAADSLRRAVTHGTPMSIRIESSASPEGNAGFNRRLSERRTRAALGLLSSIPELEMDSITAISKGAVWTGLTKEMTVATRNKRMRGIGRGRTWRQLRDSIFPELRVSRISIVRRAPIRMLPEEHGDYYASFAPLPDPDAAVLSPFAAWSMPEKRAECRPRAAFALRSNLLYDLAAVPNIGVDFTTASGWAAGLSGMYAWWGGEKSGRYWRIQGFELTLRHYFGRCPFSGWHVGLYGQMLRYDFCLHGTGYVSGASDATFFEHPTLGAGVDAGYALRISDSFRLDFSAGFGHIAGQYQTYTASPGHHSVWESTRHRRYWGPSKAEVALVWILGKGGGR